MLNDIIKQCQNNETIQFYLHFAYQHMGKLNFDQLKYKSALEFFELANEIRKNLNDQGLIKSTQFAIDITKEKIKYFNQFRIIVVSDSNEKSKICSDILKSLPDWFGIKKAILDYSEGVRSQNLIALKKDDEILGFVSLKDHFPESSCEIYVMGLKKEYHNRGLGSWLLNQAEGTARNKNHKFLSVKTLSAKRPDPYYDLTRKFYLTNGFLPIEEFKTLWDESNPCLLMIKAI